MCLLHNYDVCLLLIYFNMKILVILLMILNSSAFAADVRYCGYVSRTIDGSIKRSTTTIRCFQALYPCPSTGKTTGACPGWSKDHIYYVFTHKV